MTRGEGKSLVGQLRNRVDGSVGRRKGVSGGGCTGGAWRVRVSSVATGWSPILLRGLNCSLHWVIGPIISSPLIL